MNFTMTAMLTAAMFGPLPVGPEGFVAPATTAAPAPKQPAVEFSATPAWAARAALVDLQSLPPAQQAVTRYVWVRNGTPAELAALSFAVNAALSRVNIGILPGDRGGMVMLHGGRLVRLDLSLIATEPEELANLIATWERLAEVESDFTVTIREDRIVDVDPPVKHRGKLYSRQHQTVTIHGPQTPVASEINAMATLMNPAGTPVAVPIIDSRELIETALTTLEGGIYYEFRGIDPKWTLKQYLEARGASQEQVAQLESLEKAVVLSSKVTGKERMVSLFRGAGVRASTGAGLVSLTFDPFDEDRSPESSAIGNLLNFDGRGSEVIVELANGFHEWTLWNDQQQLLRVAPQNLVSDHEIPEPHTRNLQPGISCIRCHGHDDGWRGFGNDVPRILAAGVDIFGDLSSPGELVQQQQLMAGLYGGDWFGVGIGPFSVGRLTYDRAVFRATGKPIAEVSNLLAGQFVAYAYTDLDAWAIATELGIVNMPASDGNAETDSDLQAACAVLAGFVGAPPAGSGVVVREDPVIASILAGISVPRRSWESCKHIAYERLMQRSGN